MQAAADATAVAACSTYSGAVTIATSAPQQLNLDNSLQEIDGDLNVVNCTDLASLSFGSLQRVQGTFRLNSLTALTNLEMPQLTRVGSIDWSHCNALQGLVFNTGIQTVDQSVIIQDTNLQSVDAINIKGARSVLVANNRRLGSLNWQLGYVNDTLVINANQPNTGGLNTSFPNLMSAGSIDISNASSLIMPSLAKVQQSLTVYGSYFQTLSLPNLTQAGGVSINNNAQLSNLSLPMLGQDSGALRVFNNDNLGGTLSFPAVKQIGGALNLTGSFSRYGLLASIMSIVSSEPTNSEPSVDMPQLNTVQGVSYVYSSQDITSTCQQFGSGGKLQQSGVLSGGKVSCSSQAKAGGAGTSSSSGSSSSSSSSKGAGVALGPAPGTAFSALGILAALFGVF